MDLICVGDMCTCDVNVSSPMCFLNNKWKANWKLNWPLLLPSVNTSLMAKFLDERQQERGEAADFGEFNPLNVKRNQL